MSYLKKSSNQNMQKTCINETSNKEVLKLYHKKPTQYEDTPDTYTCGTCHTPLKQSGRFYFCPLCSGKAVRLKSGKNIKRNQKF